MERREEKWGVKLLLQPLTERPMMFIAEIKTPTKSNISPDTRIWFDGVPANKPMRMTEVNAWRTALLTFLDAVKEEGAQMRAKAARRRA